MIYVRDVFAVFSALFGWFLKIQEDCSEHL